MDSEDHGVETGGAHEMSDSRTWRNMGLLLAGMVALALAIFIGVNLSV